MIKIPLSTQGKYKGKYFALIDDDDFEKISKHKWYVHFSSNKKTYYAFTNISNQKKIRMHRYVMNLLKDEYVDHIDGNGYNNQKFNLRKCTLSENKCNRRSSGKIKYLGVYIINTKKNNKVYTYYRANITHNNKGIYLGIYKTAKEAAIAYNEAAIKYHKEFANINII